MASGALTRKATAFSNLSLPSTPQRNVPRANAVLPSKVDPSHLPPPGSSSMETFGSQVPEAITWEASSSQACQWAYFSSTV